MIMSTNGGFMVVKHGAKQAITALWQWTYRACNKAVVMQVVSSKSGVLPPWFNLFVAYF